MRYLLWAKSLCPPRWRSVSAPGEKIACTRQLALLAVEAWVVDITLQYCALVPVVGARTFVDLGPGEQLDVVRVSVLEPLLHAQFLSES